MADVIENERLWEAISKLRGPGLITLAGVGALVYMTFEGSLSGEWACVGVVLLCLVYVVGALYLGKLLTNGKDPNETTA